MEKTNRVQKKIKKNFVYFLATTALDKFWDRTKTIVFLGEWCKRYSSRRYWKDIGNKVVTHPWKNYEVFRESYSFAYKLYNKLIIEIAEILNRIHGECFSERYWRIIIGPWLMQYISILQERYMILKSAKEQLGDFDTLILAKDEYIIPKNTREFFMLECTDLYNLQLYSSILLHLDDRFSEKNLKTSSKRNSYNKKNFKIYIKKLLYKFNEILLRYRLVRPDIIKLYPLPVFYDIVLFIKTRFKQISILLDELSIKPVTVNYVLRSQIQSQFTNKTWSNTEFKKILFKILPFDIPKNFIEEYKLRKDLIKRKYPSYPKYIFSLTNWINYDDFKIWAALAAESGTKLIGCQHGGNYGSIDTHFCEDHELKISDKYYTWGWSRRDYEKKIKKMPVIKLIGRKNINASNIKTKILYARTNKSRYFHAFQFFTPQYYEYLDWGIDFLKNVDDKLFSNIYIRLNPLDYGWDTKERLIREFKSIKIDDNNTPFFKVLEICKIFVCDNLATTFIEALSANVPTILFWDPQKYKLRCEASSYYKSLHSVGILHYSPQSAAAMLNRVYKDVEYWWNDESRKKAIKSFCNEFARTSPSALKDWVIEMNSVIRR